MCIYLGYEAFKVATEKGLYAPEHFKNFQKAGLVEFSLACSALFGIIIMVYFAGFLTQVIGGTLGALFNISSFLAEAFWQYIVPLISFFVIFAVIYLFIIPRLYIMGKRRITLSLVSFVLFFIIFETLEYLSSFATTHIEVTSLGISVAGIPLAIILISFIISIAEYITDGKKDKVLEKKFEKTIYCPKCSRRILEKNAKYCPHCGEKLV